MHLTDLIVLKCDMCGETTTASGKNPRPEFDFQVSFQNPNGETEEFSFRDVCITCRVKIQTHIFNGFLNSYKCVALFSSNANH